jgi:hypothetical protein
MRFLVLAAPSGTGKTYLLETLINKYDNLFYKVPQVTTRDKREDEKEDTYIFLNKEEYDEIENDLIGKTVINGKYYGSLPNKNDHRIGIIILNEAGFIDFKKSIRFKSDYLSIGLYKPIEYIPVKREGRDEEYLKQEQKVLNMCDIVFNLKDDFVNPEMVKNATLCYFMNYQNRIEVASTDIECIFSIYDKENVYTRKVYKDNNEEVKVVDKGTSKHISNESLAYVYENSDVFIETLMGSLEDENRLIH